MAHRISMRTRKTDTGFAEGSLTKGALKEMKDSTDGENGSIGERVKIS